MTESCHIPIFSEVKDFFQRNSVHIFICTYNGMGEQRGPKQNGNKRNNDDGGDEVVLVIVIPALSAQEATTRRRGHRRRPGPAGVRHRR